MTSQAAYQALVDITARLRDELRAYARAVLSLVDENHQLEQQVDTLKGQLDKAQEEIQDAKMEIEIWCEFRDGIHQEIATAHDHIHTLETQAQVDRAAWHAKEQSLLDRIQVLRWSYTSPRPRQQAVQSFNPRPPKHTNAESRPSERHTRHVSWQTTATTRRPKTTCPVGPTKPFTRSMFAETHVVTASHKQAMDAIPPHKTYPEDTPVVAHVNQAHVSPAETWLDRIRRWIGVLQKTWRFGLLFP
ncbi:hypothetical protein LEN26_012916 [Aphanomyces euteiches]|nr:hypothetical protein LEN26_012916 [Aphanomyces euteiches]KAH9116978.1 hypothetical protein AeMF1_009080 [Aphanomyces euteiches]KAH9197993.1 hypothetical protein AeNC1_000084 [Aphanomyces euteiches]